MQDSPSQVAGEQKNSLGTSTNVAYGCTEDFGHSDIGISDMPSGAAMATQEPIYEIIPI